MDSATRIFMRLVEMEEATTVYHVTAGPWDGKDLRPLLDRVQSGEITSEDAKAAWEERYAEYYSDRAWNILLGTDGREIHCHATLSAALEYKRDYAPNGDVLELDVAGLTTVGVGGEYVHPVVRDTIPAARIKVVA